MSAPNISAITEIGWVRYANVACTMFVIYEHILQLDTEVELFWKKRWTIAKFLFLCNRYFSLVLNISNMTVFINPSPSISECYKCHIHRCKKFYFWHFIGVGTQILITHLILQLRLYAMYCSTRKILAFFITISTFEILMVIINSSLSLHLNITTNEPLPNVFICMNGEIPGGTRWAPILFYGTVLSMEAIFLALALRQAWLHGYSVAGCTLMQKLTRDSALYFFIIFWIYLSGLIFWVLGRITLNEFPTPFECAFSSVFANRLVIAARTAYCGEGSIPGSEVVTFHPPTYFNVELEAALASNNQPPRELMREERTFDERLGI
ncbi:hypothetical protein Hypma_011040 [Hypsizygus marmoreus]|uniref:DUF6533 domain-containing protein n=1 Tax=Hypsizygus marmoreus TaxID=39966 RepID=A0A369JLH6_HYPMA|nr:hypothetical protein Hypma_011040 [Hypsizygus marmoreus]